jgi:hypothetical protein
MNLMKILDIIENKLDKESGSNKSGSHKTPEGKESSRSGSKHHHHFQKNSHKKAHSSSSPSIIMNHRWYGVDDLKGEINKIKPPTFDGEQKKDEYVVGIGADPGFNATITHQKIPNYRPFWKHLRSR